MVRIADIANITETDILPDKFIHLSPENFSPSKLPSSKTTDNKQIAKNPFITAGSQGILYLSDTA